MKKKNLYFSTTIQRTNAFKVAFLTVFLLICSWPVAIIEVFTRSHFGRRHFSFILCLFLTVNLALIPYVKTGYYGSVFEVIGDNFTWYAFTVAFFVFSIKRYREIDYTPGSYDMERFTLSSGIIQPWLRNIRVLGVRPSSRIIAIYYEPALFMIFGLVLILLKQDIGMVLISCSIIYSFSWQARYYLGEQFIMDKIDEMICNEELVNTFVHNRPIEETRGFEVYGRAPRNEDFRRKLADSMIEDEPAVDVI